MWFGREGSHGVCRVAFFCCVFQTMTANAYIFMYAFHRQFNQDHAKSYKDFQQLKEEKRQEEKDNKKAS